VKLIDINTITITTYKIVLNRVLCYIIFKLLLLSLIKEPWWSSRKDHWPQQVNTTYVGRSQLGGVQKYVMIILYIYINELHWTCDFVVTTDRLQTVTRWSRKFDVLNLVGEIVSICYISKRRWLCPFCTKDFRHLKIMFILQTVRFLQPNLKHQTSWIIWLQFEADLLSQQSHMSTQLSWQLQ
jgi:hypothetical protein